MISQGFRGSLWREGSLRAVCVGGSLDPFFWWLAWTRKQTSRAVCVGGSLDSVFWSLAFARRQFMGRVCWSELILSFLAGRVGEEITGRAC